MPDEDAISPQGADLHALASTPVGQSDDVSEEALRLRDAMKSEIAKHPRTGPVHQQDAGPPAFASNS